MPRYFGECYCGAVQFYCNNVPLFTQYFHCNKCRDVSSQSQRDADNKGYAWTAGYLMSSFKIVVGVNNLDEIIRNNAKLLLCKTCHGLIYGISLDTTKQQGIGINANNFQFKGAMPDPFRPVRHIWYENRRVSIDDHLPKFKDAPIEQFGSGVLWQDHSEH